MKRSRRKIAGLTTVEMMVYCALLGIVGAVTYQALHTGSTLSAKNASLNRSHNSLRGALDRLASHLRSSRNVPTLLNVNGTTRATGPAAGIRYDRIVGEPYALHPVMTAGSLSAGATSLKIYRSTTATGAPPIPAVNDVLLVDTPNGMVRARIRTVTPDAPSGGSQGINLTLAGPLGEPLAWGANQPQWAKLVRQEAFIVVPSNGRNELRFYPAFEPMPALNNPANYSVLTDQLSTEAGEETPFYVESINGDRYVRADLRVLARDYDAWIADKQANQMNTYFRMNLTLASRMRPKTTN